MLQKGCSISLKSRLKFLYSVVRDASMKVKRIVKSKLKLITLVHVMGYFLIVGLVECRDNTMPQAQSSVPVAQSGQIDTSDESISTEHRASSISSDHSLADQAVANGDESFVRQAERNQPSFYLKAWVSKGPAPVARQVLSANIASIPLTNVLDRLGQEIGAQIYRGNMILEEEISVKFDGLPVEEGIKRLFRGKSYVVIQQTVPMPSGNGNQVVKAAAVVTEIHLLPQGTAATKEPPSVEWETNDYGKTEDRVAELEQVVADGDPDGLTAAIEIALEDPDRDLRLHALGLIESPDHVSIETLNDVALTDTSPDLRMEALGILLSIHGPSAALPVLEQALADRDSDVSALAKQTIEMALTMRDMEDTAQTR